MYCSLPTTFTGDVQSDLMSSPSASDRDRGAQEVKRDDSSDVVFSTEEAKWKAVLTEIRHMHHTGAACAGGRPRPLPGPFPAVRAGCDP